MISYYNYLKKELNVKVTQPIGSTHPIQNWVYPVNYGYIENTIAEDGEEIGAYILGIFEPIEQFSGICQAIVIRRNDIKNQLVIFPKDKNYSATQIDALVEFQERFYNSRIMR